jgi:hypothetical protein
VTTKKESNINWKLPGKYLNGVQKFKEEDHDLKKYFKSNFVTKPKSQSAAAETNEGDSDKENQKDNTQESKESEMEKIQQLLDKTKNRQVSHITFDNPILFDIF